MIPPLPRVPVPVLENILVEKFSLLSKLNLPWCNLRFPLLPLCFNYSRQIASYKLILFCILERNYFNMGLIEKIGLFIKHRPEHLIIMVPHNDHQMSGPCIPILGYWAENSLINYRNFKWSSKAWHTNPNPSWVQKRIWTEATSQGAVINLAVNLSWYLSFCSLLPTSIPSCCKPAPRVC